MSTTTIEGEYKVTRDDNGQVVARVLYRPVQPVPLTRAYLATVLRRMTPSELHLWRRAVVRAEATNSPTTADRQLCYAWHLLMMQPDPVQVTAGDLQQLGTWWVQYNVVSSAARAQEILAPEVV